MPIIFVLIDVEPGHERNVHNKLTKIQEIKESHIVTGECDIIAKLKIDDIDNLPNIIATKIRSINGVKDTRTLTGLKLD